MRYVAIFASVFASTFTLAESSPSLASNFSENPTDDLQNACTKFGGVDLTDSGKMIAGDDVSNVVVCQHPVEVVQSVPRLYKAQWGSNAYAVLSPPSGNYTVTNSNPVFQTGCSANVYLMGGTPGNKIVANSELSCNGYAGGTSAGCSVSWTGPTEVFFGQSPGAVVSVTFNCNPRGKTQIGTSMNYSWRGGRGYDINIRGTQGIINVVYQ